MKYRRLAFHGCSLTKSNQANDRQPVTVSQLIEPRHRLRLLSKSYVIPTNKLPYLTLCTKWYESCDAFQMHCSQLRFKYLLIRASGYKDLRTPAAFLKIETIGNVVKKGWLREWCITCGATETDTQGAVMNYKATDWNLNNSIGSLHRLSSVWFIDLLSLIHTDMIIMITLES